MNTPKTKVTIYDVAERANVAISTVSRVLNNSTDVSDATRERVLVAIRELKFRPDRTARTLAQQKTHTIAVALPTFTTPFHTELMKGIRSSLRDRDFDILLCDLGSTHAQEKLLAFLRRGAVDGILVAGVELNEQIIQELHHLRAPVILIGTAHPEFDCYTWDNVSGSMAAVAHLVDNGHRQIAFIRSHNDVAFQTGRLLGYRNALADAGIDYQEDMVVSGRTEKHAGFSEEAGYEAMQTLLRTRPDVTAVLCGSDVHAIGAWKAVRDAGQRSPEDIAIVGYDDIKTSAYIGLTSVDQSIQRIGYASAALLIRRIDGAEESKRVAVTVRPQLNIRQTSDWKVVRDEDH